MLHSQTLCSLFGYLSNFLKPVHIFSNLPPPWQPPQPVSFPPRPSAVIRRRRSENRIPTGPQLLLRGSRCRGSVLLRRRQRWGAQKRRKRRMSDAWTVGRNIWSNRRSWSYRTVVRRGGFRRWSALRVWIALLFCSFCRVSIFSSHHFIFLFVTQLIYHLNKLINLIN